MSNRSKSRFYLLIPISIIALFWFLWGLPTSLLLRHWFGLGGAFAMGNIRSPIRFLFLSKLLLSISGIFLLVNIGLILWTYRAKRKSLFIITCVWSLLSAQITMGTIAAFYPQYSCIAVLFDKFPNGTEYAPSFTKEKFARIQPGMARNEVEKLIGRGFTEWTSPIPYDASMWIYSKPKGNGENYWRYRVHFENGVVSHLQMEFWVD